MAGMASIRSVSGATSECNSLRQRFHLRQTTAIGMINAVQTCKRNGFEELNLSQYRGPGLNRRPIAYEATALTAELPRQCT